MRWARSAPQPSRSASGAGLGLSMIYGFWRQSGGQPRIYSEVGRGEVLPSVPQHCRPGQQPRYPHARRAGRPARASRDRAGRRSSRPCACWSPVLPDCPATTQMGAADGRPPRGAPMQYAVGLLVGGVGLPGGVDHQSPRQAGPCSQPRGSSASPASREPWFRTRRSSIFVVAPPGTVLVASASCYRCGGVAAAAVLQLHASLFAGAPQPPHTPTPCCSSVRPPHLHSGQLANRNAVAGGGGGGLLPSAATPMMRPPAFARLRRSLLPLAALRTARLRCSACCSASWAGVTAAAKATAGRRLDAWPRPRRFPACLWRRFRQCSAVATMRMVPTTARRTLGARGPRRVVSSREGAGDGGAASCGNERKWRRWRASEASAPPRRRRCCYGRRLGHQRERARRGAALTVAASFCCGSSRRRGSPQ